jgi:hypothetical protein
LGKKNIISAYFSHLVLGSRFTENNLKFVFCDLKMDLKIALKKTKRLQTLQKSPQIVEKYSQKYKINPKLDKTSSEAFLGAFLKCSGTLLYIWG